MTYYPNIMPLNEEGEKHGYCEIYDPTDGSLYCKRTYNNGIIIGYDESYNTNGQMRKTYWIR